MGKKLIVHIGANKTGSSAIQRFLSLNVLALREKGIVVPNADLEYSDRAEGFHVWTFQEMFSDPEAGRTRLEQAIEHLFNQATTASAILLSAENLTANTPAPRLFEGLIQKHEVEVILYIRRQDEFIVSSWQQWHAKVHNDFWAWALSVLGTLGNWKTHLENWERIVPREQLTVRVFDRAKLEGGDIIADVLGQLGLSSSYGSFELPSNSINPSFSDAVMDLVKGNELIFRDTHDNDFYRFVSTLTGDHFLKDSRSSFLTLDQRRALLQAYAAPNRWVQDTYFPELEGELFTPPGVGDYHYINEDAKRTQQLEFLTTILFQMWRRLSSVPDSRE